MAVSPTCSQNQDLETLATRIRDCRLCLEHPLKQPLPHEPRPVVHINVAARLCIAGQAPGTRVHKSGIPFDDPSGDRLRTWMGIDRQVFYDQSRLAIVPMGFCFPGLDAKGGIYHHGASVHHNGGRIFSNFYHKSNLSW